jgi:hypothetical protein
MDYGDFEEQQFGWEGLEDKLAEDTAEQEKVRLQGKV